MLAKSSPFRMKNVLVKVQPISNEKCASKVQPVSNENVLVKSSLFRMKMKRIKVLTSGEVLRRMQNNVFQCENSMYCQ
jgi:hypothetical protein